ncbi:MAG: hypothetical protein M1829_003692 [Trizodia sp. TS-e1964]|nr:MAG: hypothetical protein M1829_003692 [Trizodia sp. TS-e1964]
MYSLPFNIQRIAIVGAGPSGLAAAKYLRTEQSFKTIDIYEQQCRVGGVWIYTPNKVGATCSVPQTYPYEAPEQCRDNDFITPMYDELETNIPHNLMQFSDFPFPKETQLYPGHRTVLAYIESYARELLPLIQFSAKVLNIEPGASQGQQPNWRLQVKDLVSSSIKEESYDAIVIASGHFAVPYIPDAKGIASWNLAYPGVISHSKCFVKPSKFKDKKVLVVGNSASGVDIGTQIGRFCLRPLLISQKSPSHFLIDPAIGHEEVPPISEFIISHRAIRFEDGRVETEIDAIVFCTGYFYSFPFLRSLKPDLITDGTRTQDLYKHLFCIHHPSLAFLGIPHKILPFPTSESQAAAVANVWSNKISLPSQPEMLDWEANKITENGAERNFHTLGVPHDTEYINDLHQWCSEANITKGSRIKSPPYCDEKFRWTRERFQDIALAFRSQGASRCTITNVEQLGFNFEKWEEEKRLESKADVVLEEQT